MIAPMPWPEPQMSRQAFGFEPVAESKFIVLTSPCGRLSGSKPALTIDRATASNGIAIMREVFELAKRAGWWSA